MFIIRENKMKYIEKEIKTGIKLHTIKTEKFKCFNIIFEISPIAL